MKFEPTLHKLSNGATILLDPMDIETVTMKIRVNGGTRVEKPDEYGISHFLEHMLFNGTAKYPTTKAIRDVINDSGGVLSGLTGIERTVYYGRILAENFHVLLDVLSDIVLNPKLAQEDVDIERGVVNQEIKRSQADQVRQFNGLVRSHLFAGSYLDRYDGLGSPENLESFTSSVLADYKRAKYTANNIIIGISGKLGDKDKILKDLETLFGDVKSAENVSAEPGKVNPSVVYDVRNDKKQTKIFIGFENGYPDESKYYYETMCLGVFANSLAKRLVEEIRDKRGLVYNFTDTGYGDRFLNVNGFMTSLSPGKLVEMISCLASGCYDMLRRNPVASEELNRRNIMARLARANFFESSAQRRDKLISFYADHGYLYNQAEFDEMRARITIDDVMKYSADYFSAPLNIIAQGPKCDIDMRAVWDENFK
ncbi:MAG: insulinase family protein [Rickettsiales bacterium]|jgi:predicted Zn-dependent peptidase|nr:insulinase family protein [Rickettsiales bacterium]